MTLKKTYFKRLNFCIDYLVITKFSEKILWGVFTQFLYVIPSTFVYFVCTLYEYEFYIFQSLSLLLIVEREDNNRLFYYTYGP